MLVNPLFDSEDDEKSKKPAKQDDGYVFQHRKGKTIQPISTDLRPSHYTPVQLPTAGVYPTAKTKDDAAVELIRSKVAALYTEEPDIKEELLETIQPPAPASKHQLFMQQLSTSGKSLATIQNEWHRYYIQLSDQEKHEVWQEFYQNNTHNPSAYTNFVTEKQAAANTATAGPIRDLPGSIHHPSHIAVGAPKAATRTHLPAANYTARREHRSKKQIKRQILDHVTIGAETQKKAKQHVQSLLFGLGTGLVVLLVLLFGFFNEVFIAPFIQPSRHAGATPIIVTSDSVSTSSTPEVIIPKINVQIPVVYDEKSIDEASIQRALERGIIHYPTTVLPGQQGNTAFFGHSSNNLFNKGKYKFAFVLLHELVPGDIFHLSYNKQIYTYRVFDRKVVAPSEVSVLSSIPGKTATAALITCDPPGTSTNRLVVWGEQISPDPSGASAPVTPPAADGTIPTELPSEGPTLWGRFWKWLF